VYTHLTVTDTQTIIERETVEVQIVDTSMVESVVTSFAQVYYSWSEGTEQSAARNEALRNFLTDDLLQLNQSFARDMDSSSTVQDVQIWNIERLDDRNFRALFSVERLIRATVVDYEEDTIWEPTYDGYYWEHVVQREVVRRQEDAVRSYYTVIVHVDDAGNAVITHNPTIHGGFERSGFAPPTQVSDTSIDGDMQREITLFLTEFFTLYPTASESMLSHFVRGDALAVVEMEYEFLELVQLTLTHRGESVAVHVTVRYYDPRTRAQQLSQFELLVQEGDGGWVIVCE